MKFIFKGDENRVYIGLCDADGKVLVAKPGQTYEMDAAPDDRFVPVGFVPPLGAGSGGPSEDPPTTSGDANVG
jgi:hypothetical protein